MANHTHVVIDLPDDAPSLAKALRGGLRQSIRRHGPISEPQLEAAAGLLLEAIRVWAHARFEREIRSGLRCETCLRTGAEKEAERAEGGPGYCRECEPAGMLD